MLWTGLQIIVDVAITYHSILSSVAPLQGLTPVSTLTTGQSESMSSNADNMRALSS
jgi:hypothetical protein